MMMPNPTMTKNMTKNKMDKAVLFFKLIDTFSTIEIIVSRKIVSQSKINVKRLVIYAHDASMAIHVMKEVVSFICCHAYRSFYCMVFGAFCFRAKMSGSTSMPNVRNSLTTCDTGKPTTLK